MTCPTSDGTADERSRERLLAELHRADLLLRRHLEGWWTERASDDGDFRGLFVSDAEVDGLLATPEERDGTAPARGGSPRTDRALSRALGATIDRIEATRKRAAVQSRLAALASEFDLDRDDLDALVLALAPDLDRKYRTVYGYLQDDVTRVRPTVGLLVRVLATDDATALDGRRRFERGSTLVDEGLVTVADTHGTDLGQSVSVPTRVALHLVGDDGLPEQLVDVAVVDDPDADLDGVSLAPDQRARLSSLTDRFVEESPLAALVGSDVGTATAAAAALVPTGHQRIRVEAQALVGPDTPATVDALRREARLRDGVTVHVHETGKLDVSRAESPRVDEVAALLRALDRVPVPVVVTGDVAVPERLGPSLDCHRLAVLEMGVPGRDRRATLWRDQPLPATVDTDALADAYRLTADEIEDAAAVARSRTEGQPDTAAVRAACRAVSGQHLDEHARRVDPSYDWSDIVLPPETERRLREAAAGLRNRGTVFESWGFADRYGRGTGVTLLFTGPSGTGKTMAAEVLATDVGLPLYAVDLATMLSKYVGETEENLSQVFDAAERANAVLLFDEADALFGERSEVSDAHDRYANVEVDYLLQRLEDHDGCVVLASNLAENIDDAFRRRVDIAVEFPHPDRAARTEIWADAFPEETPTGELDVEFLARFELTGGNITTAATTAAFLAAEAGECVEMPHVVRALKREFAKEGRLIDAEAFDEYDDARRFA